VPVEVVGGQVEQHCDVGRQLDRVLGLEAGHLADDRRVGLDRADQRRQRRADVAGDGDRQAGGAPDRAEQLGGGGLAVGAGDGHEAIGQQAPGQLQLARHGHAQLARAGDHGSLVGDTGALDDDRGPLEGVEPVRLELGRDVRRNLGAPAVDPEHLAVRGEHARRGDPRARQADHEVGALRQRRAGAQEIDCW
jgi:hypothetical protein